MRIEGMPVIDAWRPQRAVVVKRSMASGHAGVPNPLFFKDDTQLLVGGVSASGGLQRGRKS